MKNPGDLIGIRTHDFSVCHIVKDNASPGDLKKEGCCFERRGALKRKQLSLSSRLYMLSTGACTSQTVPGSIPGGVTGDFFSRGFFRQNHVPWGWLSLWKWVPGISLGVKAAGAFGWRPTTLVVPNVVMIRGLNLPGTPRATSACRGIPLLFYIC